MWEPAAGALESRSERGRREGKRGREGGVWKEGGEEGNEWGKEVEKLVCPLPPGGGEGERLIEREGGGEGAKNRAERKR